MEKLDYLIKYLIQEKSTIPVEMKSIPNDIYEKKCLYISLCSVRSPEAIDEEYIKVEDEYLQEELKKEKIAKASDIRTIEEQFSNSNIENSSIMCLWRGDITLLECDAIINPANSQGLGCFVPLHKCLDNQIGCKAGVRLRLECNEIMKKRNYNLETGKAIITKAYNLLCKNIIHTVGPIVEGILLEIHKKQLADCYINSLKLAIENNIKTIAFPCISTGLFMFPKDVASRIAIKTVDNFLKQNRDKFEKVLFSVYSEDDYNVYRKNLGKLEVTYNER